jgi:hypothetical protein
MEDPTPTEPAPPWYARQGTPVLICCLLIAAACFVKMLLELGDSNGLGVGICAVMSVAWLYLARVARSNRQRMGAVDRVVMWLTVPAWVWLLLMTFQFH